MEENRFIYEPHCHTSETSRCGQSTGKEMVQAHYKRGYTGIFITDHFLNGNTIVSNTLPWKNRIDGFCRGYEMAKEEGDKIGLDVFFGFEYCYQHADFLIYNLDKEWLLNHENIDICEPREAFKIMREDGGFIIHAHPFRERDYINHIHLFPRDIDGVEVYNARQAKAFGMNERAVVYARMYELTQTAGADSHNAETRLGSGIVGGKKLKTSKD